MGSSDEFAPPYMPEYVWIEPHHLHAFLRAQIDVSLRPIVDGFWVPVAMFEQFKQEWSAWYDTQPGPRGHVCTPLCAFVAMAEVESILAQHAENRSRLPLSDSPTSPEEP